MHELFHPIFANGEEKAALQQLIIALDASGKRYFLRNEILHTFSQYCQQAQKPTYFYYSSSVGKLIQYTHEIVLAEDGTWFVVRPRIASQEVWRLTSDLAKFDSMSIDAFLDVSDRLVNAYEPNTGQRYCRR